MESLDNFYRKQRENGYIQRVYNEKDGSEVAKLTEHDSLINPPLFAWLEWRYFKRTGDDSRLARVLPRLVSYFHWVEKNLRARNSEHLSFNTPLGSGMDNVPRPNVAQNAYIDMSCQQALAAHCISEIAGQVHDKQKADIFSKKYKHIASEINARCWSEEKGFYFDLTEENTHSTTKHLGAYWSFLANIASEKQQHALLEKLQDPKYFWRPHLAPALSADDPAYNPEGEYWRGGVWAPTNYMLVCGLRNINQHALARKVAENQLSNLSNIYHNFLPHQEKIPPDERYNDGYHTLWECYSPEHSTPATRWDASYYSRQNFVGWTGLGPIAMLIEDILGIEINASKNEIHWRLRENETHGIQNLLFHGQTLSLLAEIIADGKLQITVASNTAFTLNISTASQSKTIQITGNPEEIFIL